MDEEATVMAPRRKRYKCGSVLTGNDMPILVPTVERESTCGRRVGGEASEDDRGDGRCGEESDAEGTRCDTPAEAERKREVAAMREARNAKVAEETKVKMEFKRKVEAMDTLEELETLMRDKTTEYNALRQRISRSVFVDLTVLESQSQFERLDYEIETLRSRRNDVRAEYETKSVMVFDGVAERGSKSDRRDGSGNAEPSERVRSLLMRNGVLLDEKDAKRGSDSTKEYGPSAFVADSRRIKPEREHNERTVLQLVSAGCPDVVARQREYRRRHDPTACDHCGGYVVVDTKNGYHVCDECGHVKSSMGVLTDGDVSFDKRGRYASNSEHTTFRTMSTYKPLNHFVEILSQLQGKRKIRAPEHIQLVCYHYCVRYGIKREDITEAVIRKCLRRYKSGNQFYKYAMEIACKLRGVPPPHMTDDQEATLVYMYPCAVRAYRGSPRYVRRAKDRVGRIKKTPNNQTGSYVLYKLCELCGFHEFLPYLRMSNSMATIRENDESWQHVCGVNRWKYIPTRLY